MNQTYGGPERRSSNQPMVLTDDQIDAIAKKAAERAVEQLTNQVYQQIGKGVVRKFFYIVGVVCVAVYLWLVHVGIIAPPHISR